MTISTLLLTRKMCFQNTGEEYLSFFEGKGETRKVLTELDNKGKAGFSSSENGHVASPRGSWEGLLTALPPTTILIKLVYGSKTS